MSPKRFKEIRMSLELTQEELGASLGLGKKTVTQYEIGFRKPGKTVAVIMNVLAALPSKRRIELLSLLRSHADALGDDSSRSRK